MRKIVVIFICFVFCTSYAQDSVFVVDMSNIRGKIPSTMYGLFFEDINFGADGGLYAELIKNRSFEFPQPFVGWIPFGNVSIKDEAPCFNRNPHYVRINNNGGLLRAGIENEGFTGIGVKQNDSYRFSFYARTIDGDQKTMSIELIDANGVSMLEKSLKISNSEWQKYSVVFKSTFTDAHAHLRIVLHSKGVVDLDHISLFPVKTWKGRENGLRADLAQVLYDLKPGFLRFPGGCIVEGNSLSTRYQWKNSVGPIENRPLNENRWNYTRINRAFPDYFQSLGLGFYEYFLLSEDLGAEPLPVLNCGLSCQYESNEVIPLAKIDPYVQDALDLIEFANGSLDTKWGKLRAEMGHPSPFNLKMIAIGNEQWGKVYVERLEVFVKAIREHYPQIKIIGSAGPSASGGEFDYLWPEMKRLGVDLVDEHYYMSPEWFQNNARRYDLYDREGPKVFAGEYAAHDNSTGNSNNLYSAISEAAFMTGLERNSDVVSLAAYAPLFAHIEAWQWNPDLIWFDNLKVMRTPNYYVQQIYGMNKGTEVVELLMNGLPIAGQEGLYATAALDSLTNELILKIVNVSENDCNVSVRVENIQNRKIVSGIVTYIQNDDPKTINTFEKEEIYPRIRPLNINCEKSIKLELPKYFFGVQ